MTAETAMFVAGLCCFVGAFCLLGAAQVQIKTCRALLAEIKLGNEEFCEAVSLLRYGATDEAIEVAGRAAKRRKEKA